MDRPAKFLKLAYLMEDFQIVMPAAARVLKAAIAAADFIRGT